MAMLAMAAVRPTLAKAIQKSSTTASFAAPDKDNVGSVYTNGPPYPSASSTWVTSAPPPQAYQGTPAFSTATPLGTNRAVALGPLALPAGNSSYAGTSCGGFVPGVQPPGNLYIAHGIPPPTPAPTPTSAASAHVVAASQAIAAAAQAQAPSLQERYEREMEQLKRELRKANEKSNFFRSQVIALQQQVASMGAPIMGAHAAATMPEELHRLRTELAEERAERQALHALVQRLAPEGSLDSGSAKALQEQLRQREHELTGTVERLNAQDYPGGSRRAVIVGCDYPGRPGAIRGALTDAQQWARFLVKRCGLLEQDLRLLSDQPAVYQRTSTPETRVATRENILRALHWLTSRSAAGDQLFFIFCGAGAQMPVVEYAGQQLCEAAMIPADFWESEDPSFPRYVSDTDVHRALLNVPEHVQVTLVHDSSFPGRPLDRTGPDFLFERVRRARDLDRSRNGVVLGRLLEMPEWKAKNVTPESPPVSELRCRAVQWAACGPHQFAAETHMEGRARGLFTYWLISALLKVGPQAPSNQLLREVKALQDPHKQKSTLQQAPVRQDVQVTYGRRTDETQPFCLP